LFEYIVGRQAFCVQIKGKLMLCRESFLISLVSNVQLIFIHVITDSSSRLLQTVKLLIRPHTPCHSSVMLTS